MFLYILWPWIKFQKVKTDEFARFGVLVMIQDKTDKIYYVINGQMTDTREKTFQDVLLWGK